MKATFAFFALAVALTLPAFAQKSRIPRRDSMVYGIGFYIMQPRTRVSGGCATARGYGLCGEVGPWSCRDATRKSFE